jgi:hypothetical protein
MNKFRYPTRIRYRSGQLRDRLIVRPTWQTKRDPQYMRVPGKATSAALILDLAYGSVTTQYPGVTRVAGEIGCVRFPLESTDRGPNCVRVVLPLSMLLYTIRFEPD